MKYWKVQVIDPINKSIVRESLKFETYKEANETYEKWKNKIYPNNEVKMISGYTVPIITPTF